MSEIQSWPQAFAGVSMVAIAVFGICFVMWLAATKR
jgi:hypothetical protein